MNIRHKSRKQPLPESARIILRKILYLEFGKGDAVQHPVRWMNQAYEKWYDTPYDTFNSLKSFAEIVHESQRALKRAFKQLSERGLIAIIKEKDTTEIRTTLF